MKRPSFKSLAPWVVAFVAAVAAVTFGVLWAQARAEETTEDELRSTAREFVAALTNFSADSIDADAERIKSFAVGAFEQEAEIFFGERATEAIEEAEATSEGEIESLYVQSIGDESASVFAVVNQSVSNAGLAEPKTDVVRMEVGLVETSSGWKVDRVEVIQSPGTVLPGTESTG